MQIRQQAETLPCTDDFKLKPIREEFLEAVQHFTPELLSIQEVVDCYHGPKKARYAKAALNI
jgi:hypothetical protein